MRGARNFALPQADRQRAFAPARGTEAPCSREAGIDLDKAGRDILRSGVTAAVITLALETIGHTDNRLYDGSWSEWGGGCRTRRSTRRGLTMQGARGDRADRGDGHLPGDDQAAGCAIRLLPLGAQIACCG